MSEAAIAISAERRLLSYEERVALVRQWTPKVHSILRHFERVLRRWYDAGDLLSIGLERLWFATLTYDDARGAVFGTYAHYHVYYRYTELVRYHRSLPHRGDLTAESLEETWSDGTPKHQLSASGPQADDLLMAKESQALVGQALLRLPERSRAILQARFFDERSLEDIGGALEVSRERVRQLEKKALVTLRESLSTDFSADPTRAPLSCKRASGNHRRRARKVAEPPESP